jgi:hypothetical protein
LSGTCRNVCGKTRACMCRRPRVQVCGTKRELKKAEEICKLLSMPLCEYKAKTKDVAELRKGVREASRARARAERRVSRRLLLACIVRAPAGALDPT